jgi:hypothetical protein
MEIQVYDDSLIEISDNYIRLKKYYFPSLTSKKIQFDRILRVDIYRPSVWTGSWRIWGTGDFRTWFPLDMLRPQRDKIFIMTLQRRWFRIGFTVENAGEVERILGERGLVQR